MDSLALAYELPVRKKVARERVFEIDFLRGFDILLMLLLHFCYDLSAINIFFHAPASGPVAWVESMRSFGNTVFLMIDIGDLFTLEFFFSGLFMFLSGISCSFSHSNFTRAVKLSYVAVLMTLALEFADHLTNLNVHIYLGILHSLAIAMLLFSFAHVHWPEPKLLTCPVSWQKNRRGRFGIRVIKALNHFSLSFNKMINAITGSYWTDYVLGILFTIALGVTLYLSNGPLGWTDMTNTFPKDGWKLVVGMARAGDDYFSPMLTCALMFLGAVVGKTLYKSRKPLTPAWFPKKWANPVLFLGQHSLEAYILHQPLSILALWIILAPVGYRLG
jgi:uncharacterized membrane protein